MWITITMAAVIQKPLAKPQPKAVDMVSIKLSINSRLLNIIKGH